MDALVEKGIVKNITRPPRAWHETNDYLRTLISHSWYHDVHILLSESARATHEFFGGLGANCALVPITTGSISSPMGRGSDSLPVEVAFGSAKTYLADSMQFYLELCLRIDPRPSYYLMSSFRGEESDERHLNQFFHAEVEIAGAQSDIIALAEQYVCHLAHSLLNRCSDAIENLAGNTDHIKRLLERGQPFPQVSFEEARKLLSDEPNAFEACETGDLKITRSGEAALIREFEDFVWLTGMPASTVPFYQAVDPKDSGRSLTGDLLAGIGEVLGSGERARTLEDVDRNLKAANVSGESYRWYLEMKTQSPIKTAGFGLGIERFLMWLTRTNDIRDWSLIPRDTSGQGPL